MKIGDEIKQEKFETNQQKAVINLIFTHNWFKEEFASFIKEFGITAQQFNVLRILNGQYPNGITTGEIRERMLDKMSDASRLVDRLEKCGKVAKERNKDDRRLVKVVITEKGRDLVERIRAKEVALYNPMNDRLTDEEAAQLSELLDKMRG
ncbi:MarR family winged helix-turn-helix transcriptional regulator [Phaeocystidibacter marisrubri]|uniref:MarR family transcriptional regulator n=1 Tax=Phaeocystidibacter marisrubri TaxID=1577780 RepID=A0A6L3ZCA1_9FLAO|nr:MarR family transcriptional regulator [Phaeocystidibacter marisrubri]KAB2815272.1 MarR family transcriptional regulator [Phaeocystidibacter marisrubri]GGH71235.1 MarR family transcriptional regulator [Phaeocystidibacter marisrubri]